MSSKNPLKCVVVGDTRSGKTCLLLTFAEDSFPGEYVPSQCDSVTKSVMIDDNPVILDIWEVSACPSYYDRLRPLAYPETDIFVICFSISSSSSLERVEHLWYPELKQFCPKVPKILVGTKLDLRGDKEEIEKLSTRRETQVTTAEAEIISKKIKAVKYIECSALTQKGVKEVFEEAARTAILRPPPTKKRWKKCLII